MGRILANGKWHEPISSRSILESEYEQSIFRYADNLFPGYWCLAFNELIESKYGSVKADMVLIDEQYRGWTVIEAELEHHSFSRHVEPQMRKLVNGKYGQEHANAILRVKPDLEHNRLKVLIKNSDPDFLVVVPKSDQHWKSTLANMGIKMAVVEIFMDKTGNRVVNMSGDLPKSWPERHLTKLLRDQHFLPRSFRVETPAALPDQDSFSLMYHDQITTWRKVVTQKATFILPNGSFDLESQKNYSILRNNQENLEIVEA